jgi:hypothetical protein
MLENMEGEKSANITEYFITKTKDRLIFLVIRINTPGLTTPLYPMEAKIIPLIFL